MIEFPILFQNENYVVIDKPPGFFVHQPEDKSIFIPPRRVVLTLLRKQLRQKLYPVHRLDVATSGCLAFALNSDAAKRLQTQFVAAAENSCTGAELSGPDISNQVFNKRYLAVARGFMPAPEGLINSPLQSDSSSSMLSAISRWQRLAEIELPYAVGKRHPTARYSLVRLEPLTGRFHQLRRHMARTSHPLLGDAAHGDSHHNRFFREVLHLPGLLLRSYHLSFTDPYNQKTIAALAPWPRKWRRVFELFNWETKPNDAIF